MFQKILLFGFSELKKKSLKSSYKEHLDIINSIMSDTSNHKYECVATSHRANSPCKIRLIIDSNEDILNLLDLDKVDDSSHWFENVLHYSNMYNVNTIQVLKAFLLSKETSVKDVKYFDRLFKILNIETMKKDDYTALRIKKLKKQLQITKSKFHRYVILVSLHEINNFLNSLVTHEYKDIEYVTKIVDQFLYMAENDHFSPLRSVLSKNEPRKILFHDSVTDLFLNISRKPANVLQSLLNVAKDRGISGIDMLNAYHIYNLFSENGFKDKDKFNDKLEKLLNVSECIEREHFFTNYLDELVESNEDNEELYRFSYTVSFPSEFEEYNALYDAFFKKDTATVLIELKKHFSK